MGKYEIAFWPTTTEATYRSQVIQTKDLPEKIRIIMRHNKYKKKGDNKPNYIAAIVEDKTTISDDNVLKNISKLKKIIEEANRETSIKHSPEESSNLANKYWTDIINEIEDLTEEKINICTWGVEKND